MRADGVRGHLDLVLLGVLAVAPGHGYAIINELKQRTDGILDLPEGSVYPALHRLEDLGLVVSKWRPVAGRRRREYRLTEDGTKALAAEGKEWRRLAARSTRSSPLDQVQRPRPRRRHDRRTYRPVPR